MGRSNDQEIRLGHYMDFSAPRGFRHHHTSQELPVADGPRAWVSQLPTLYLLLRRLAFVGCQFGSFGQLDFGGTDNYSRRSEEYIPIAL